MQPKILVCLGRISAAEIIKPDFRITQEHGRFFEKNGIWMTALYQPDAHGICVTRASNQRDF